MIVDIDVHLEYEITQPTRLLLQIEAAGHPGQHVQSQSITFGGAVDPARVKAEEGIGHRTWLLANENLVCNYRALVNVTRKKVGLETLLATPLPDLPPNVVSYLMPSRFCQSDQFQDFTAQQFGNLSDGEKVAAMVNWVNINISYVSGVSHAQTTAVETFSQGQGVCRDMAHLLIVLLRAGGFPARYVSVYSPGAVPQDFHAIVEVFLDGKWHMVDPTGMADPLSTVLIGVGRDSADVSFLMSFGPINFIAQSVKVSINQK